MYSSCHLKQLRTCLTIYLLCVLPTGTILINHSKPNACRSPLLHARVVFPVLQAPIGLVSCPSLSVTGWWLAVLRVRTNSLHLAVSVIVNVLVEYNGVRMTCSLTVDLLFFKGADHQTCLYDVQPWQPMNQSCTSIIAN